MPCRPTLPFDQGCTPAQSTQARDVLGLARRPCFQIARRAAGAARIHPHADVAVRHPLLRVEQLPVLVLVAGAFEHVRRGLDDPQPLALVALLHRQALGVGPVAQDHRIFAVGDRPEHVGAQHDAVVHLDRGIPIDLHSVADFGFHAADASATRIRCLRADGRRPERLTILEGRERTKEHVRKRRHHRRRPVGLHAAAGAGPDRAALHARRGCGGAEGRGPRTPATSRAWRWPRSRSRRTPRSISPGSSACRCAGWRRTPTAAPPA